MSFMRRNTRKATEASADPAASTASAPGGGGVAKPKIFIKDRREHVLELGYELPDEYVGEYVVVAVGLTRERRMLVDAEEVYRAKTMAKFNTDPKKMLEDQRLRMDAMKQRDKVREVVMDAYQQKFGIDPAKYSSSLSGLLAYQGHDEDSDEAIFASLYGMDKPAFSGEAHGGITLTQMPQDEELDIFFYFNVRKIDERWNLAPIYELRLQTRTNKSTWAIALEQQGLSSLVSRFQANRLTSYERWAAVIDDAGERERLQIDDRAADAISALIARQGFITSAERERLAAERQELAVAVDAMASSMTRDEARFYVGQLVESGSSKAPVQEVVVHVGEDGSLGVRKFGQDADESRAARPAELRPAKWVMFLSHSQRDAQNQVQNLHILLRAAGVPTWYDMDAEKLEAIDMVRGVRDSKFFCLYLTEGYFERYFCRLEASYALETKKPLLIVFEPDFRHGGSGSYTDLVDRATHKYPEFRDWLLGSEAIPMARRAFQRHAMVTEIVKRVGSAAPRAAASGPRGTQRAGKGPAAGDTVEDLKEEVLKLWDVVETLQDEIARLKLENVRP